MRNLTFENPEFFTLYILLIPLIVWYLFKVNKSQATISTSTLENFNRRRKTLRVYLRHFPFVLRCLAISVLIFVMARPQSTDKWEDVTTEGIDIVIALDISSTMLAQDFRPNRIEAAKDVAIQFINGRETDRMGLVVFSGESFTQCPLTSDHAALINLFKDVRSGLIEDGTAIGMGLATAVKRLKDSDAKSKVVILLTDGDNNSGAVDPATAAELAKTFGIRVYTIGVGSHGQVPYPVQSPFGGTVIRQVDLTFGEDILKQIAQMTGGKYFRATNKNALINIYEEIDKLEKSKVNVKHHKRVNEEYLLYALIAAIIIFVEQLLRLTILRTVP